MEKLKLKVVSIKQVGKKNVYDIEINKTHNFLANNIVVHNCTSGGAQKLFTEAKPKSIIDIAVLTSIYRPGPLAAKVDKIYLDAKNHGKKFDWGHPLFETVLGETYNCLSGDTKILTDDGEIRIDQIKVGQSLPTLNELTGELVNDTVIAVVENGIKELYEIETEIGLLKITGEHKVLTESRGWIEVKNLTLEDKILTPKSSAIIKSIKKILAEKVYDIQTKQHNFIANGHIVHNCLIFQESVMSLAEHIGGFPKEKCDDVRRAIMKRDLSKGDAAIKEAQKMEDDFVSGAAAKGIPESTARKAYQNILWFAGYGFNKSLYFLQNINIYKNESNVQIKISDVQPGDFVDSRDEKTGNKTKVKVKKVLNNGVKPLVCVKLKGGKEVICSMNHKFRTTNGYVLSLAEIIQKKLSIQDQ